MKNRPLCAALVLFILGIIFWKYFGTEEVIPTNNINSSFVGEIEEIRGQRDKQSFLLSKVYNKDSFLCEKVIVYPSQNEEEFQTVKIGNVVQIRGEFVPLESAGNEGQFDEKSYYLSQGIQGKIYLKSIQILNSDVLVIPQKLHEIRSAFYEHIIANTDEETGGVICAMLLGDKSALDDEVKNLYTEGGIGHILAISGLHVSLIGAGLFFVLRKYIMPIRAAAVTVIFVLICYGELTGFSVATKRAVIMMIFILIARMLGETYDALNALAASAWIELLNNPMSLFTSGFLLSYATALGILLFMKEWNQVINKKAGKLLLGNVGMFLMTLPIVLCFYFEVNILTCVINTFILPFLSIVMTTGFLCGLGGGIIAEFIGFISSSVLRYNQMICELFTQMPYVKMTVGRPEYWQILLYYGCLTMWIFCKKKWRHILLVIAIIGMLWPAHTISGLKITMLDVGQGDCSIIQAEGHTIMIDGGSTSVKEVGKYRLEKWLKYYGIRKLDYVFITHSDEDHVSAIEELIKNQDIAIGCVVLPDIKKKDEGYVKLENECMQTMVKKMNCGDSIRFSNDFSIQCFHPYLDYDWPDENNYSLVLGIQYQTFSALFAGDLGIAGEKEISNKLSHFDLLKVGHHGSKGSSGEDFLNRIKPKWALISCGKKNRYGHPHKELLERLKTVGSKVFRTDEMGAINCYVEAGNVRIEKYR